MNSERNYQKLFYVWSFSFVFYVRLYPLFAGITTMLDSRMLPPFNWKDNMQKIIVGHKDVKILARSSSGNIVDCLTSSILLSAYSSTLRKSFDSEEDNYVLFCQDFSEDCVRSVLGFLTFGDYIDNMGHQLTSEVVSFLTALNIKGFHVDGGFKCKTESSFQAGSSAKVKLSVVNGLGLQVSPLDIKSEEKELKNLPEYPEPIGYEPGLDTNSIFSCWLFVNIKH